MCGEKEYRGEVDYYEPYGRVLKGSEYLLITRVLNGSIYLGNACTHKNRAREAHRATHCVHTPPHTRTHDPMAMGEQEAHTALSGNDSMFD
jgi:hypothetical protein